MTLYIVGTPIGNLGDMTARGIETLKSVDLIAAEDTRVTKKLLSHFQIHKPIISYREYVHDRVSKQILAQLGKGKTIAYVTDAGVPGISDPGARLVRTVRDAGYLVVPIPGVSAVTSLMSVAGVATNEFLFLGFPPQKKGRTSFFEKVKNSDVPVVIFESPHRLCKTLAELGATLGSNQRIVIGKELTKIYETIIDEPIGSAWESCCVHTTEKPRGEYVICILRG
ncbi:MAG: 16S rRNA (cytidine(1402)-2'-O)-methyltransferase [Patescibacteria group bacterium]